MGPRSLLLLVVSLFFAVATAACTPAHLPGSGGDGDGGLDGDGGPGDGGVIEVCDNRADPPENCGDGVPDPDEECDLGAANGTHGSTCFLNCTSTTVAYADPIEVAMNADATRAQGPVAVEAVDFNGDGRLDLLSSNLDTLDATVLYGFGDGRFAAPRQMIQSSSGTSVVLADVNEDGLLDAITTTTVGSTSSPGAIQVFLGTGDGFTAGVEITVEVAGLGGLNPSGLAVADVTGNGNLDVLTANRGSNDVTLLAGDGAGGFTPTSRFSTAIGGDGNGPIAVAIADVTGNGELDIVTANITSDDVTLLEGQGRGSFSSAQVFTTRFGAGGAGPTHLVLADVTGNGRPDVITANASSDDVTVLASNGAAGLGDPARFVTLSGGAGATPRGVAVADVTGDDIPDIVVASESGHVTILRGLGPGVAFASPVHLVVADDEANTGQSPQKVAVADLTGNGTPDIVTMNLSSSDLTVFVGEGDGEFRAGRSFRSSTGFGGTSPRAFALGDVNGDGHVDAVTVTSNAVTLVAGLGDGRLAPAQTIANNLTGHAAVGDFDRDGLLDFVFPANLQVRVARQRENGEFPTILSGSTATALTACAAGNLDSDPDLEVVCAEPGSTRVLVFENDGLGSLSVSLNVSTPSLPQHLALADVTGDQVLDIVVALPNSNAVAIFPGTGEGTFGGGFMVDTAVSTSGVRPVYVLVADLDGDGINDIVTANANSNDLTLLLGIGSGSFAEPVIIPTVFGAGEAEVSSVRVGDFNCDELPDLVAVNSARDTVSVIMGFGNGEFAAPQTFAVGDRPTGAAVGDFSGDGRDDIAVVNAGDGSVTILLGRDP